MPSLIPRIRTLEQSRQSERRSASDSLRPPELSPRPLLSRETLGIDHVIAALRTRAGPEGTPGRTALLALADSADSQVQAATAGGVDAIVQAMRAHDKRAPVQEWAVWALKETAVKSAANRALIGRSSGALQATISAMRAHSAAVGVQDHSCRLMAVLCQADAENTARAVSEGAIDAVITAIILHPLSQSVQQHGFAALAAVAAASAAGLERVRGARCIGTVLEGIERFPQHKGVQVRVSTDRSGVHCPVSWRGAVLKSWRRSADPQLDLDCVPPPFHATDARAAACRHTGARRFAGRGGGREGAGSSFGGGFGGDATIISTAEERWLTSAAPPAAGLPAGWWLVAAAAEVMRLRCPAA